MQLCACWLWARKTWVKWWYTMFHLELVSQAGSAKIEDCKQAIQFPKNLLQIRVILTTAILIEMGMKRAQHISEFRSKYRNYIFLLVMLLVFSQP